MGNVPLFHEACHVPKQHNVIWMGRFRCVTRTNRRRRRLRSGSPISPDPLRVSWSMLSLSPANVAKTNEWVGDRDLRCDASLLAIRHLAVGLSLDGNGCGWL